MDPDQVALIGVWNLASSQTYITIFVQDTRANVCKNNIDLFTEIRVNLLYIFGSNACCDLVDSDQNALLRVHSVANRHSFVLSLFYIFGFNIWEIVVPFCSVR